MIVVHGETHPPTRYYHECTSDSLSTVMAIRDRCSMSPSFACVAVVTSERAWNNALETVAGANGNSLGTVWLGETENDSICTRFLNNPMGVSFVFVQHHGEECAGNSYYYCVAAPTERMERCRYGFVSPRKGIASASRGIVHRDEDRHLLQPVASQSRLIGGVVVPYNVSDTYRALTPDEPVTRRLVLTLGRVGIRSRLLEQSSFERLLGCLSVDRRLTVLVRK